MIFLKGCIYSSSYYHHQIGSINLNHCVHIFPWLWAWDVFLNHIMSLIAYTFRENGVYFHHYCAVYDECKWSDVFWLADCIRLLRYTISLSSLYSLIWRHWNYKMPVRYILSSVWVRLIIFSQLSIIQYMGLCDFSLSISLVMIERIHILCLIVIIKSEVWILSIV